MKEIEIFLNIWNRKYPEFAGRIGCNISVEVDHRGVESTELILDFADEDSDGLYYKVSYICKVIFGNNTIASFTHDNNGWFRHVFHVKL